MSTLVLVFAVTFVLSFIPLGFTIIRHYRRFRRPSVVACPETGGTGSVKVNAGLSAFRNALFDEPRPGISSCSNWPGHEDCGRGCAEEVESSLMGNA